MVLDRINELLGNEPGSYLSCAEVTAAMAMADINILGMETINPGDGCPQVLVLYEYKWRYGEEQQQTKWNRAVYMWQGVEYHARGGLLDYYDEAAIMLDIMERVASVRGALSEATGTPRHGRI